jgi:glycosyltransferase involved in cell wall biosynthesis
MRSHAKTVLHIVGQATDEVFSFLGPATAALLRDGRPQAVILIGAAKHRRHIARLRETTSLYLVPKLLNPFRQWRALFRVSCEVLAREDVGSVHLHGFVPGLIGAVALRVRDKRLPIYFSPHASRLMRLLPFVGTANRLFLRPLIRPPRSTVIVNFPLEAPSFARWKPARLIENPVRDAFFSASRVEAPNPVIVTGGRIQGTRNAQLFAQLAVLLTLEDLHIDFHWVGEVDAAALAYLNAAPITIVEAGDDAQCAAALGIGWVYVAPGPTRGFPLFLTQAMALGLPCVAFNCAQHREVIVDGINGFLCASEREMMLRIATLVDDPGLRKRFGEAGREGTRQRFGEMHFGTQLLAAYTPEEPMEMNE